MSEYFDDIGVYDGQESGRVLLLGSDSYLDDSQPALTSRVATNGYVPHLVANLNSEWDCSFETDFQPNLQSTSLRNSGDGADIPLLLTNDSFSEVNMYTHIDHCHTSLPVQINKSNAVRQLYCALAMCLVFMITEVVGGYFAGSLAVMTDAAHLTSDFVSFLVSLFAIWLGKRPPSKRMTFGYHRAEVLGALLSVAIIWMLTAVFICLAIQRIIHRDFVIEANTMMVVAAIGIVINIIMGVVLHGACSGMSHTHGHSHSGAATKHEHPENINVRAAVIHVLGDFIQSVGVLIAAVVIKFYPSYQIIDPVCTLLFSLLALATTGPILKDTIHVLMEAFPRSHDFAAVSSGLRSIPGVRAIHDLHVWCLTISTNALSVHLAIDPSSDPELVLKLALLLVREKYNMHTATIQVEKYNAESMLQCHQCQPPAF